VLTAASLLRFDFREKSHPFFFFPCREDCSSSSSSEAEWFLKETSSAAREEVVDLSTCFDFRRLHFWNKVSVEARKSLDAVEELDSLSMLMCAANVTVIQRSTSSVMDHAMLVDRSGDGCREEEAILDHRGAATWALIIFGCAVLRVL